MQKATIHLKKLASAHATHEIEEAVRSLEGVDKDSVKAFFAFSKVELIFDSGKITLEQIEEAIKNSGHEVTDSQVEAQ
ncbi:MAG: heavy-metal-associated domain-containing protein [Clostridia bacterium]|nr:heavy-metal-associated domain-containing protein [Clostridia bacterium]